MSGYVAVAGGQEHQHGCEDIDRRLLAESRRSDPVVAVLLGASVPRVVPARMAQATEYWSRLGATARFAFTGQHDESREALDVLESPDLVVLTGGRPWLLQRRLSPALTGRLRQLWESGVPLSGSSAGAMAMCEWRLDLEPRQPLRFRRGLGLVPGVAAPHYGRHGIHHVSSVVSRRFPELPILGLPDRTALVGREGRFDVVGAGSCTVLLGGRKRTYSSGETLVLAESVARQAS